MPRIPEAVTKGSASAACVSSSMRTVNMALPAWLSLARHLFRQLGHRHALKRHRGRPLLLARAAPIPTKNPFV